VDGCLVGGVPQVQRSEVIPRRADRGNTRKAEMETITRGNMSEAPKLQGCMSNSELQEAITMANAMAKSTAQDSPTYPALRAHLENLLHIQQARAAWVYCGAERPG